MRGVSMNIWVYIFFIVKVTSVFAVDFMDKEYRVTVFIHGTHLGAYYVGKALGMEDYVFHPDGLYSLEECSPAYRYGKVALKIAQYGAQQFPQEHFYLFCWSGKLSHNARVLAAYQLHEALNALMKKYGNKCIITLITHSHGGNVALNLAEFRGAACYKIDTLVLLAVPVQEINQNYVDSSLFENVFSIYSRWDVTQIGDLQGLNRLCKMFNNKKLTMTCLEEVKPLFSERKFHSKKVKHIEVRQSTLFGHRPLGHIEFIRSHFIYNISSILKEAAIYNFNSVSPMIFNIQRSLFYDIYFGNV